MLLSKESRTTKEREEEDQLKSTIIVTRESGALCGVLYYPGKDPQEGSTASCCEIASLGLTPMLPFKQRVRHRSVIAKSRSIGMWYTEVLQ